MTPTVKKLAELAELAGLGAVLVAIVVWLMTQLAEKASEARAGALERRQQEVEIAHAEDRVDLKWMKSALWALTQRAGVVVAPPPGGVIP